METSQLAAEAAVAGAEAWDSPLSIEAVSEDCVVVFSLSSAFVVSLGQKRVEVLASNAASEVSAVEQLRCEEQAALRRTFLRRGRRQQSVRAPVAAERTAALVRD